MSILPQRATVFAMRADRTESSVMSPGTTRSPAAATAASFVSLRARRARWAPRFCKTAAKCAPIPSDAPVMMTTFPFSESMRACDKATEKRNNSIMARLLPLFPLQMVVFPGSATPLHIFEDRYKEMVGEAEAEGTEFGIVLARDGGIMNAGCTVVVESVLKRYPDGRFDVMTRGQRRFVIQSLNQDKDYLRGEVD